MARNSPIEWTDHTFNPWIGCAKVAQGCKNCYAETSTPVRRGMGSWGPDGRRHRTSESYWRQPLAWNRAAERAVLAADAWDRYPGSRRGESRPNDARPRVFCASLADVFEDRPDLVEIRADLWDLIGRTPFLDWLLLTKRPENVARMTPWQGEALLPNVWIGASASTQEEYVAAVDALSRVPAAVRFLSLEPLLGPIDLDLFVAADASIVDAKGLDPSRGDVLDWIIVGGESGPHARTCATVWIREIAIRCREANVRVFVKQLGSRPYRADCDLRDLPWVGPLWAIWKPAGHPKGGDPAGWPNDLREFREFPEDVR